MKTNMATHDEEAIAHLIETYREGFLALDPARLCSIWDNQHDPLIYVAQEKHEPIYGGQRSSAISRNSLSIWKASL